MAERKCLECGDVLRGRSDQKYCNDQCRNAYNNKLLGADNNTIRRINRILRKNHLILSKLNPDGKATISKNELITNGFDFNYFTNIYTTRSGRIYYFCYDKGYAMLDTAKVILVTKQDYVN